MKGQEIDRILAEDEILPSSGFIASVMEAVRREAAETPSIPFPWKRALPGLFAFGLLVIVTVVLWAVYPAQSTGAATAIPRWIVEFGNNAIAVLASDEWRPIELALLVTFFSLVLPLRTVFRRF